MLQVWKCNFHQIHVPSLTASISEFERRISSTGDHRWSENRHYPHFSWVFIMSRGPHWTWPPYGAMAEWGGRRWSRLNAMRMVPGSLQEHAEPEQQRLGALPRVAERWAESGRICKPGKGTGCTQAGGVESAQAWKAREPPHLISCSCSRGWSIRECGEVGCGPIGTGDGDGPDLRAVPN